MISLKRILLFIFNHDVRRCFLGYNRALIYAVWKKDYPRAIKEYQAILKNSACEPIESLVYRNLGEIYQRNDNILEAEKCLRKSLELKMKRKGHDAYLYQLLGDICIKTGNFEEALLFYEKAIQFGSKGFINKNLVNMDEVVKQKFSLEKHKELLPFMTAYFEQNKHRFLKTNENTID
jgi:tetratricopeptide (TPR) repeat protein